MRGPVFGQEQVGAAGEAEARLALSVSAEAGTRTQGWDRGGAGLPDQDAGTALLSIADKRLKYRKIRSRTIPVQISFRLVQISFNR